MASKHSEESHKTSVVNTLVRTGEGFIGHNTDVAGFIEVFKQLEAPRAISLLGSGATARSAALALSRSFPKATIQVMARSKSSAEQIVHLARSFDLDAEHVAIDAQVVAGSDLVLSTLPGDVFGDVWKEVSDCKQNPAGVLIDVAYDPWPSRASTSWAGLSFSGLELLIWQAIEQVVLFAKAQGEQVEAKEDLYEVMKNSVSEYRTDN
jgi:shikimate dehydrogenase